MPYDLHPSHWKITRIDEPATEDPVNPAHYKAHPSGVEAIQITEHFNFNIGNAIKYCWRAGLKGDAIEDLEKAKWYIAREIERLRSSHGRQRPEGAGPDR